MDQFNNPSVVPPAFVPQPSVQPPQPPQSQGSSAGKLVLIIVILVVLGALSGGWYYYNSSKNPTVPATTENNTSAQSMTNTKVFTKDEVGGISAVEASDYEQAIIAPPTGLLRPEGAVVFGPALVSLKNDDLEVLLPALPNLLSVRGSVRVFIDEIRDRSGAIHVVDKPEDENGIFTVLDLRLSESPVLYFSGSRHIFLTGVEDSNFLTAKGKVILTLPVNIESVTFTKADIGKPKTVNNASITLDSITKTSKNYEVKFHYQGRKEALLTEHATSEDGSEQISSNWSSSVIAEDSQGVTLVKDMFFDKSVSSLVVYVAEDSLKKVYNFTVKNSMPEPTTSSSSGTVGNESEKEQIISAILTMQDIMGSKDVKRIKTYFAEILVLPEEKAELDKKSDKDILDLAEFLFLIDPITAEQMRLPSSIWQITDTKATVKVITGENETVTKEATKINGKWH